MPTPKKPAPKPDLLETFLAMAAAAAKKAFVRLRNEYRAGREGHPDPARPLPRQTGPAWWTVLGVRETASRDQVVAAYRDALRKTHPDKVAHLSDKCARSPIKKRGGSTQPTRKRSRLSVGGGKVALREICDIR